MKSASFKDSILIILLVASSAFLVCPMNNYHYNFLFDKGLHERDLLYKILGEARRILSISAYINADVYYHGGVYKIDTTECDHVGHDAEHVEGECEHEVHVKGAKETKIPKWNILPFIGEKINIGEHRHLYGEEEKELLPWYNYAAKLDPYNVDAYVLGGYTVGRGLGRTKEAIKFLNEGLRHNPDSWEIYGELGWVYYTNKKDPKKTLEYLHKAEERLTEENSNKYDRREIYILMAECYKKLGNIEMKTKLHDEINKLFPPK